MFNFVKSCISCRWRPTKIRRCLNTVAQASRHPISESAKYCKDLVRKKDYEGFLVSHFYPKYEKDGFFALKAFSIEMATFQDSISNELTGKMRLQFWRDAIKGITEGLPPGHPIALALHEIGKYAEIRPYHLRRLLDAREAELRSPTHLTIDSLTAHAESTSSTILYSLLSLLALSSESLFHAASHLGIAQTFTTLLRGFSFHAMKGRVIIPAEITAKHGVSHEDVFRYGANAKGVDDAVFELATLANDHLLAAREVIRELGPGGKVPARAIPVFLSGIPVSNYLRRLEKTNFNVFSPELQQKDWKLPWQIWRGYFRGEF